MKDNQLHPRQSLNKAFLKVKPNRENIEAFKTNLRRLLEQINEAESEEFHKNLVSDFLKNTYYSPSHFINTKGRNDLVIHNGKDAKSSVGVILEAKKPTNKGEMLTTENLNSKAFQELVLYFLRERITGKNLEIRYLVATNIYEWFIFDATVFEEKFAQNKALVKQFTDFEEKRLSSTKTDFFYKDIAKPAIAAICNDIPFTHFDIRDYEVLLQSNLVNNGLKPIASNDRELISLFKVLSPEHLLKLPFANDSNRLDKAFYSELLYIIGLMETKEGSKKLIGRKKESDRNVGSLLENAIEQLDSLDKISQLNNPEQFGETYQDRLFNVGLELAITWINRVLFLKLLEAQLIKYHRGDQAFTFLNLDKVQNYDKLNQLFFGVLARKQCDRIASVKKIFANVPYLNSSLFEPTEIEQKTIFMSNLSDERLPIFGASVLKDNNGKRRLGDLAPLEYLFEFLNAYDFSSEGSEDIQEENKTLINASVLGLIFEKINGYKDGSFFTPSFITMYMCRETIRRSVVQKFNDVKGWNCENLDDLYESIKDKKEGNAIINSLRICDPAVGSGHFLVSALNEMISIKSELRILLDRTGKSLKDYHVEVVNDELIVTDDDGLFFEYKPKSKESQRVQETLFHEKQTIIENCLFGVDINPNSVKICRLRLWIELLKNAYYQENLELETLPNIDINIKCGNSLISRFALNSDLRQALNKNKHSIEGYRLAVQTYRNAESKEQKREMERLINDIKGNFKVTLQGVDPNKTKLRRLEGEVYNLENQTSLFEESKAEKKDREKKIAKLSNEIAKLTAEIEHIESGKIYENALEWRFEFPEVLSDSGDFVGFDVVIGNPPYIRQEEIKDQKPYLQTNFATYSGTADLYVFFVEKGFEILKDKGQFCYIMPNKWMQAGYGKALRTYLLEKQLQAIIDFGDLQVFEEATTYPCIINALNYKGNNKFISAAVKTLNYSNGFDTYLESISNEIISESLSDETWIISSGGDQELLARIKSKCVSLAEYIGGEAHYGIKTGLTEAFLIPDEDRNKILVKDPKSSKLLNPVLRGRNINRWYAEQDNLWLISTFPALNINIDDYPAIRDYLLEFGKQRLEQSGENGSRKKTSGEWFETQDNIAYWQEFEKPKIMYQTFQVKPCFIYDDQGLYCNNSMWIIAKADKVLLAILNSNVGWWLISKYCTAIQNGFQLIWKYFGQIPIPQTTESERKIIEILVDYVLYLTVALKDIPSHGKGLEQASTDKVMTQYFEKIIDALVYELYLSEELQQGEKHFMRYFLEENLPVLEKIKGDKIQSLRDIFKKLFHKDHPIAKNLFFLDSIKTIRIIEGKR